MSGARLPNGLPMSFGNDSPFPPMSSPRPAATSSMGAPSSSPMIGHARPPPPLPPSRAEALHREQQIRQQQQYYGGSVHPPPMSPRPGHLVSSPPLPPAQAFNSMPIMAHPIPPMGQQPSSLMPSPSINRIMSPRPDMRPARTPQPPTGRPFSPAPYPPPRPPPMSMPMPVSTPPPGANQTHTGRPPPSSQPSLSSSFNGMQIHKAPSHDAYPSTHTGGRNSFSSHHRDSTSSSSSTDSSALSITLPDIDELSRRRDMELTGNDDRRKAAWCKDVLKYVDRKLDGNRITDPALVQLVDQAINLVDRLANAKTPLAEALYLRGDMLASGSFPSYHPKDLRSAFNDFELSARMGYAPSWFRIGRDYEVLGDMSRARDAYERGCSVQDVGCIYRMGMANLLGQLELGVDHTRAIPLLKEAADLVNVDTPQPSYVYGMLLAGEFNHVQVAKQLLVPEIDQQRPHLPPSREGEARRRIQRAAFLNFAPAQYRMGWLHEYAQLECAFDPLLSVQYYSLASQGGEVEADLALSKWFLCGAEGCFEKNESLAFTFADKAAAKGLPSAEFAMGYYFDVGVGCEKDLDVAKKWYRKAASHGNEDAKERIEALAGPDPSSLSRKQHEAHVDTQLQRKRTEAKMLSDRRASRTTPLPVDAKAKAHAGRSQASSSQPPSASTPAKPILGGPSGPLHSKEELSRRMTMRMVEEVAQRPARMPAPVAQQMPKPSRTPPPPAVQGPQTSQPFSSSPGHLSTPGYGQGQGQGQVQPGMVPGRSPSPSPQVLGGPRRGSDTPLRRAQASSSGGPTQSPAKASSAKQSIPVLSAPSMGPDTKVYETFGEMGFNSSSTKDDKDCVIC